MSDEENDQSRAELSKLNEEIKTLEDDLDNEIGSLEAEAGGPLYKVREDAIVTERIGEGEVSKYEGALLKIDDLVSRIDRKRQRVISLQLQALSSSSERLVSSSGKLEALTKKLTILTTILVISTIALIILTVVDVATRFGYL